MKSRAWGTRYDTLSEVAEQHTSSEEELSDDHTNITSANQPFKWSDEVWDEAITPSSDWSKPSTKVVDDAQKQREEQPLNMSASQQRSPSRLSHPVSIFVASLPNLFEDVELRRHLGTHFQSFQSIQHIKVIHDQRGAPCAFVQVDDVHSAQDFIHKFDISLFHGRNMRCELARAFRTLLVSFRIPPSYAAEKSAEGISTLVIPSTMRIRRLKDKHQIQVLFNEFAVNFSMARKDVSEIRSTDPFSGGGILFDPLKHTQECIKRIAESCGDLEYFRSYVPPPDAPATFPPPHDGERARGMSPGVWEIKWSRRDDAATALQVLLQLPHVAVSWAHQQPRAFLPAPMRAPSFQRQARLLSPHLRSPVHSAKAEDRPGPSSSGKAGLDLKTDSECGVTTGPATGTQEPQLRDSNQPASNKSFSPEAPMDWKIQFPPLNSLSPGDATLEPSKSAEGDEIATSNRISAPIVDPGIPNTQVNKKSLLGLHNDKDLKNLASIKTKPISPPAFRHSESETPVTPSLEEASSQNSHSPEEPLTPAVGQSLPRHVSSIMELPFVEKDDRELRTIFVGSLENTGPGCWNESRVKTEFEEFGLIEDIKYMSPADHNANAFAFVRFDSRVARDRAINQMHGRVFNGRRIRVQAQDSSIRRQFFPHGRRQFHNFAGDTKSSTPLHGRGAHSSQRKAWSPGSYMSEIRPSQSVLQGNQTAVYSPKDVGDSTPRSSSKDNRRTLPSHIQQTGDSDAVISLGHEAVPFATPHGSVQPIPPFHIAQHPHSPMIYYPHHGMYPYPPYPHPASAQWVGYAPPWPYNPQLGDNNLYVSQPTIPASLQHAPIQPTGFIESHRGLVPVYPSEALRSYLSDTNMRPGVNSPGTSVSNPPSAAPPPPPWSYLPYPLPYNPNGALQPNFTPGVHVSSFNSGGNAISTSHRTTPERGKGLPRRNRPHVTPVARDSQHRI